MFFSQTGHGLFYSATRAPGKIEKINLPPGTKFWEPLTGGILAGSDDSLHPLCIISLDGITKLLPIPFPVRSVRLVNDRMPFAVELSGKDSTLSGIYSVDLDQGRLKKIGPLEKGKVIFYDARLYPVAAEETKPDEGTTLFTFNRLDNRWDTLVKGSFHEDLFLGGFTKILSVTNDGKTIYFTSNESTDKSVLFAFHPPSGLIDTIASSRIADLLPFGWSSDTEGNVTSVVGLFAHTVRVITTPAVKNDFNFLRQHIKGDVSYLDKSADGNRWLIRELNGGPSKIFVYDRKRHHLIYLFSDYPALDTFTLSRRYAKTVTTRDGLLLPVHVYLPAGKCKNGVPGHPLPTVLYVHGGPWVGVTFWNSYFYWRNYQLLANRGYAVIVCEFRGSTGLGKHFTEIGYKKWGTNMDQDLTDIAHWAVRSGIALKNKIAIWGWSYGGYAVMAGLAFSPHTYACGLAMYGISDLESFSTASYANGSTYWKKRIGDPIKEKKLLTEQSPINYIKEIRSPLLLTTGTKDQRVAQSQMENMADSLLREDKQVLYFYYPDEGHDYEKQENWCAFWAIAEKFLAVHLGGRYQPDEGAIEKSSAVLKIIHDKGFKGTGSLL